LLKKFLDLVIISWLIHPEKEYFLRAIFLSFLFFLACSPSSPEDFQAEGESLCRSLAENLQNIHNKEDALEQFSSLQKQYKKIAHLLALSQEFYDRNPELLLNYGEQIAVDDQGLAKELDRLYKIPGMREVLEKAQKAALQEIEPGQARR
jgi:hypothetical protein